MSRPLSATRVAMALLGAFAGAVGTVAACSEGGGGTGHPLAKDVTIPIHNGGGEGVDDDTPSDGDGGSTNTPGNVDCSAPTRGFQSPDSGPYCTFMENDTRGYCQLGQHCCIYEQSAGKPSTCNAAGAACGEGVDTDFECDEPSDCPGDKPLCCFRGTVSQDPACPERPRYNEFSGTYCTANTKCDGTNLPVCSQASECTGGKCRFWSIKRKTIGACVP